MTKGKKERNMDPGKPLAQWTERDRLNGRTVDARVLILNGPGCTWAKRSGCTMCGYENDVACENISESELEAQIGFFKEKHQGEPYIKIFTSGSFLDPDEIPLSSQFRILKKISEMEEVERILVESRPEFMKGKILEPLKGMEKEIEIAVGLETTSDRIRGLHISKGFSYEQYLDAGRTTLGNGFKLKTYLLMKPPMISERGSVMDMVRSIRDIHKVFPGTKISINPMNIQANTQVESLYSKGGYRPPWLWSLLKVLEEGYEITSGRTHLMSSPTAGGRRRGAHNCGKCDGTILELISDFSLDNSTDLSVVKCDRCFNRWQKQMRISDLAAGYADRI